MHSTPYYMYNAITPHRREYIYVMLISKYSRQSRNILDSIDSVTLILFGSIFAVGVI